MQRKFRVSALFDLSNVLLTAVLLSHESPNISKII